MSMPSILDSILSLFPHIKNNSKICVTSSTEVDIYIISKDNKLINQLLKDKNDLENRFNTIAYHEFKSDRYYLALQIFPDDNILRVNLVELHSEEVEPIRFFTKNKYLEFSNFYPLSPSFIKTKKYQLIKDFRIKWKGKYYPTSEHIYQCEKYLSFHSIDKETRRYNEEYSELIRNAPSAGLAAKMGKLSLQGINMYKNKEYATSTIRQYKEKVKINPNWYIDRYKIMVDIVKEKFDQHEDLRALLLSTYPRRLIEESPYDDYWGEGKSKNGRNYLGRILMVHRYYLALQNN